MNSLSVMDQIIESLAFEVEAVSQENRGQISTGPNGNPINVKIRIRKKDQDQFLHQGIISIPRTDHTTSSGEKIRLSSSDQTIMSFNVFMQGESMDKPSRKQKRMFSLFKRGGCLGIQTDEDDYEYSRGTSKNADMDSKQIEPMKRTDKNYIDKRNFTLTKNYGNFESSRNIKGKHKDFLGKCKPGGCLDPPFNEDKYSYVPTLIELSRSEQKSIKLNEFENNNAILKPKEEVSNASEIKEQTACPSNISLLNINYSNSIITYPSISSTELLNKEDVQKSVKSNKRSKSADVSNNSKEFIETYYISPKKIKINKIQERTVAEYIGTDIGIENHHSEFFSQPVQKNLNEQEPLKVAEDTVDVEASLSDSYKPEFKDNNENIENLNLKLSPYKNSLVDLRNDDKQPMNFIDEEINLKDSLNNTIKSINRDADSFIAISNSISFTSTIPEKRYNTDDEIRDINSFHGIPFVEKDIQSKLITTICERDDEEDKLETGEITNPEKFKDDKVFQITKENDFDEATHHQKENIFETDTELSKPFILSGSKETNELGELPDNDSANLNEVFTEQNNNVKDLNVYGNVVLNQNSNYSSKQNSDLFQFNSDIKNSLQNIQIPPVNMEQHLNSDVLSKDTKYKSNSSITNDKNSDLTLSGQKNNETPLNNEQNLLDTKIDSKIFSTLNINNATVFQLQDRIESKQPVTMERNSDNNLNLRIDTIPNNSDYDLTDSDSTSLPVTKESQSQVEILEVNDPKSNPEHELENGLTFESTFDKISVITGIGNEIMETASKMEVGSFATKGYITNREDFTKLNIIEDHLTSEPKIFNAPNLLSTDANNSLHTSITEITLQDSQNIHIKPIAKNLETEDHKINRVDSILSLSIDKDVQKPSKIYLHSITDEDQTHSELSINKDLKTPQTMYLRLPTNGDQSRTDLSMEPIIKSEDNENQANLNKRLSLSINDLQKQLSITPEKLPDKVFINTTNFADNADSSTEIGLRICSDSLNVANKAKKQKDDSIVDLNETTAINIKQNDNNEYDTHNLLRSTSKTYMEENNLPLIYLNMAFQSFNNEKNESVIRTLDTSSKNKIKNYPDDNILQIMTLIRFDGSPITIPIDKDKNLLLQITKVKDKSLKKQQVTMTSSVSSQQYVKQKSVFFDKDHNKDGFLASSSASEKNNYKSNIKNCISDKIKSEGNLQQTLDSIYNEELLPLHNIIKNLKDDVIELARQQLLIKDMLHSENAIQFHEMKTGKKCGCNELLSIKR